MDALAIAVKAISEFYGRSAMTHDNLELVVVYIALRMPNGSYTWQINTRYPIKGEE